MRYSGADWIELASGTLGLAGALAVIECRIDERIDRLDHTLLIETVTAVHHGHGGVPLVHLAGRFVSVSPPRREPPG